jgi:3-deoxy-D-manno-octulosonic-acid transferase
MHGASVGEGLAILPLVERIVARGLNVLVTTGTVSSARILAPRLPAGAIHQYAPLDSPAFVRRLFDHWRPGLVVLAESEIWPNFLCEATRRATPVVLVNGRMSQRSFDRWRRFPNTIKALLARIDLAMAQGRDDARRLAALGAARVSVSGNLKHDAPPPPADPLALAEMNAAIGPRPGWFAASTHPEEEAIIVETHAAVLATRRDLLTIVAPRHAERGVAIFEAARAAGLNAALR